MIQVLTEKRVLEDKVAYWTSQGWVLKCSGITGGYSSQKYCLLDPPGVEGVDYVRSEPEKKKERRVSGNDRHEKRKVKFIFTPSQEFYKSLGWLCANAEVIIHTILKTLEDKFVEKYFEIKGHDVPVEYDLQENLTSFHYGSELRVVANSLPNWNLDTGNKTFEQSHVCSKLEHNFTIYSNNFVWWLLNNGFDFVEHQDVEAIRSNIPEIYRESFDSGYSA